MTQTNQKSQAAKIDKVKKRALEAMRQPFHQKSAEEIKVEMRRQAHYGLEVYVSQWGDTLSQLALASGRDVVDLVHDNNLSYQDRLDTASLVKGILDDLSDDKPSAKSQASEGDQVEANDQTKSDPKQETGLPSIRLSPEPAQGIAPGRNEDKTSMLTPLFDLINQERQRLGLHTLKETNDQGGFIRALNDQALLYSYQNADQDLLTEIKLQLADGEREDDQMAESAWSTLKDQPLLYQQVTQALYRSHYASLQANRDGYELVYGLKTSE
ncbi:MULTISPECIES: hypothetical protein [Aerococcus]|uniref:Uncharacterized protein n=1 Tax=Aerococcus sanguinicola TaxID=119206 RepID=A0A5N1GIP1_9LACT|nr:MULTISPECIES: hypothetical protein [Aerococcus]KAA9300206.1 hypothetical protein F6I03_08595 [Aerococcus sanguinicola]MDK6369552.1 hypothetical protein [Aerococcus sp. UMB9870]MDK6680040.1 hypothetical protein [Aerococcus sp. UMB8608]MDK6686079.1 hypothetical protein [Aerococcus sp. UMB8623]MDK6939859.1 hypothetical protein [Aerococcus sp. UMB8487]